MNNKCENCPKKDRCLPYILGAKAIIMRFPKARVPAGLPQEGLAFEKKDRGKKVKIEWVDKHE